MLLLNLQLNAEGYRILFTPLLSSASSGQVYVG